MATTITRRDLRLRLLPFGHDRAEPPEPADPIARFVGVVEQREIPPQAEVTARLDRPDELNEVSDGGAGAGMDQPYRFERASLPATFNVSGVPFRTTRKVLQVTPTVPGRFVEAQRSASFAAFAPPQGGALVQSGRSRHTLVMVGPSTLNTDREILRLRWEGTPVAAATLITPAGGESVVGGAWPTNHARLAPGSIIVTLSTSEVLRDDGTGQLVWDGVAGSDQYVGIVNYVTGEFEIRAPNGVTFPAAAITVDYEHDCGYAPIDVNLEWDPLLAE